MENFIPLSVPNLKGNEIKYVTAALEEEWVSTAGKYIEDFENIIKKYVNIKGAVACQSGTAGLHLGLITCGVQAGDEVIVPTLTFIAAINPIKYIGAEPVFMDCNNELTLDEIKLKKFCEEECSYKNGKLINKNTNRQIKAIVVVHIFGNLANMEAIMKIAKEYNLKVIEDATEALGSYYIDGVFKGDFAGTIGDVGVYSFNGNKIITTGGGGMLVTNQEAYEKKARYLSTQAKDDTLYFVHNEIGYNYRMTNLQAALGIAQMEQLEEFIKIKKENYEYYKEQGIILLDFSDKIRANYWFYSFKSRNRDGLIKYLEEHRIQTRPIWKLIHTQRPYQKSQAYKIEQANLFYNQIVNIPCSTNLKKEEIKRVAEEIKKYEECC